MILSGEPTILIGSHDEHDARNLLNLLYSLVMVSFPVEVWRQPHIPDRGAAYLDLVDEPIP